MNNKTSARNAVLVKRQKSGKFAIKIRFPFNHDDLDRVRTLPDRKWNGEEKYWIAPLSIDVIGMLKEWKFTLDPRLEEYLDHVKVNVEQIDEIEIPGLKHPLYPFQKKGVAFIERKQGRALIADEMGLGKTIQALAWLQLHPELRPVVITVPASLKLNWAREAEKWMNSPELFVINGKPEKDFPYPEVEYKTHQISQSNSNEGPIIIINYDILPNDYVTYIDEQGKKKQREIPRTGWVDFLLDIKPQILITDECHYYKNNKTNRTKGIQKLGKAIPHVLALSGTPIVNHPVEIFNAIKLIDEDETILSSFWHYARRYCEPRHNGYGWDFSGASNTKELHEKLTNSIMIRRLKKDVLPELPEKIRSYIPMELNNWDEYIKAQIDFIGYIRLSKGPKIAHKASTAENLTKIEALKQLAVRGKLTQCIDWIRNFLNVDGKLIVFGTHKFVISALMEEFGSIAVKVDGSVTGVNRQKAVDSFQNDNKVRLFVGNIKAAGVGITLTAASNVVFLELPWTPGEVTQAEDRCHRIGQRDSVNIHYLLANNTIEEKIARMLDRKRKVLDSVLDGKVTDDESLLSELMKEYE